MKILAIIQARMDSSRLPGKVLMKIENKTILEHIIDSLKFSKLIDEIIVATSKNKHDDKIELLCNSLRIYCFRGSQNDVLRRYYDCAKFFKGDLILRITGDNPFVDPIIIDKIIQICKKSHCQYASNVLHQTFPLGYSLCEAMTFLTLEQLYNTKLNKMSREHVTHDVRKNPHKYFVKEILAPKNFQRPNWRLTVDYNEDLELAKKIFSKLYKPGKPILYKTLVKFLDKNQEILKPKKSH